MHQFAQTLPKPGSTESRWCPVSVTELRACIAAFATGKCADPFGIRSEHLRLLDDATLALMIPFINRCLKRAVLPPHWLVSRVSPVPKRGRDLSEMRSWRPVSVTSLLCRLCETIVHNRVQHVIEHGGGGIPNTPHRRGSAQFGFRRGVSTSLALSGLSMFAKDGLDQIANSVWWNAREAKDCVAHHGSVGDQQRMNQPHVSLVTSIDGSDAFCRALPASIIRKLAGMGLPDEARWIAALLRGRSLQVKEGDATSTAHKLERGVPQGSVLGPLMWSLVVDDLIAELEQICKTPPPGCVAVPIVFADDINFAVRGFNPTSLVVFTNELLAAVRKWSIANGIPMAKLQATWITGGVRAEWAPLWTAAQGEIVFDDALRCLPSLRPLKLLGVTFDSDFKFGTHVDGLLEQCERYLRLLTAMAGVVKADKLRLLYRGLILSRTLYAVDCWYPFISADDVRRLDSLHYRACCVITGCVSGSHKDSVCYEAGMRSFRETARDEIVKIADKMRREPYGCKSLAKSEPCFGPAWVARLFRDGAMPTAARLTVKCRDGSDRKTAPAVWPPQDAGWERPVTDDGVDLRSIGMRLDHGDNRLGGDTRFVDAPSLRPLPRVHPWAPQELAAFDTHVRFVTAPPGGLVKPPEFETVSDAERQPFADANAERMRELELSNPDAIYIFTDASRTDEHGGACAGAFVLCRGQNPADNSTFTRNGSVPVSPIACIYTGELAAIDAGLGYALKNRDSIFAAGKPRRVVLVTDSKSALESVKTTWLRRIGHLEQDVARKLFDLASRGVFVTLAFVFSHAGGVPGNDFVDKKALRARVRCGGTWTSGLWNVDTTRRILRDRHHHVDAAAGVHSRQGGELAFRFRNVPASVGVQPSAPLPRDVPRAHEKLLYRARLGMLTAAGGVCTDGRDSECPLCGEDALGRDGDTFEHVAECLPDFVVPPIYLVPSQLWTRPTESAASLAVASSVFRSTPLAKERALVGRRPRA